MQLKIPKKVYVRTGDATNPYDLAKVDLILDLVKNAGRFYSQKFRGDLLVAVSLLSVQNRVMRFRDPGPIFPDDDLPAEFTCHGETVVATRVVSSEELAARLSRKAISLRD
jgi:hypothetical protein